MLPLGNKVHSSEKYVSIVGGYKEKYMTHENQESIFQAIDTALNIISQKSNLEEQIGEYKDFFDRAEPHYPKVGPVNRYCVSHKQEVGINFFRDKSSGNWNSAYISFGACSEVIKKVGVFNLDYIRKAQLSFKGVYEKEGVYPDDKGRKVIYKFKVARYLYKYNVVVDFKLTNKELNSEAYPIEFSQLHIYIGN